MNPSKELRYLLMPYFIFDVFFKHVEQMFFSSFKYFLVSIIATNREQRNIVNSFS